MANENLTESLRPCKLEFGASPPISPPFTTNTWLGSLNGVHTVTKTTLILSAAALAFTGSAAAQDTTYDTNTQVLETTTVDTFHGQDLNADGALDRAEFKAYIETKATAGDTEAFSIAESGDFDTPFMIADANADGLVSEDEMKSAAAEEAVEEIADDMVDEAATE